MGQVAAIVAEYRTAYLEGRSLVLDKMRPGARILAQKRTTRRLVEAYVGLVPDRLDAGPSCRLLAIIFRQICAPFRSPAAVSRMRRRSVSRGYRTKPSTPTPPRGGGGEAWV